MTPYSAPFWLPGGHLQTIYAALVARVPHVRYRRTRWETPDGDFIDLDWVETPSTVSHQSSPVTLQPSVVTGRASPGNPPLLVLFHGLEGDSRSHYARVLMHAAAERGWRAVVVHFRGCSGEANRLPRAYHSGDSAEIDWILRRLAHVHGEGPLFAAGISLGGNALLKWLGEAGAAARAIVRKAAAVSAPVNLAAAGEALGRGFSRAYTWHFLATMKPKALAKLARHPGLYDPARVRAARTLRAFDDLVTAPLHGFRDVDDYWTRASSRPWLKAIDVPTLMLNARNDPFLPDRALPQPHEVSAHVTLEISRTGGHVGFVSSPFPGAFAWLPERVFAFFGPDGVR